jgi:long-chain acyl-CoA synthetase
MKHIEDYNDQDELKRIPHYPDVKAFFEDVTAKFAGSEAIVDRGVSYTYASLKDEVASLRSALYEQGVRQGSFVIVDCKNGIGFIKGYLAAATMGAVAVLVPPMLPHEAIFGIGSKMKASALVYDASTEQVVGALKGMNPPFKLIEASAKGTAEVPEAKIAPEMPCAVMFTSGTTGHSRAVLLSHRAIMAGSYNGCLGIKDIFGRRYVLILPLFHVFGLIRNLMTSLMTGSDLYINHDTRELFRDIAAFKPDILVAVPALAELALKVSRKSGKNMLGENMRTIICGAAMVPPYLVVEYKKLGIALFPGYGLTESANLVSGNPENEKKPDSVGLLYPGVEAKIDNGELLIKGPNLLTCYLGDEEANKSSFKDGWFRTGDLAHFDEDGFLYIDGRCKEIIVLPNGTNVSPAEIENHFDMMNLVQDCLVYEENGRLTLEVLPREEEVAKLPGDDAAKAEELMDVLQKTNLGLPEGLTVSKFKIRHEDFKRSGSMKVLRNQN